MEASNTEGSRQQLSNDDNNERLTAGDIQATSRNEEGNGASFSENRDLVNNLNESVRARLKTVREAIQSLIHRR